MMRLLILKVRPDKIGDVLLMTPMIASLKAAQPNLDITVWVHPNLRTLFESNPDVSEVGETWFRPTSRQLLSHVKRMKGFDAVWFLKDRAGSHIPASYLARTPERIGSVRKWYGRFLTRNLPMFWDTAPIHEAELCYEFAESALGQRLSRLPSKLLLADSALENPAIPETPYFCVHPGTAGTCRPWTPEGYAAAAAEVRRQTGWQVVVTGGPGEVDLAERVRELVGDGAINLAGQVDLLGMAALLRRSKGLISGSTGATHLAATQQTPCCVIIPYVDGPSNPKKLSWTDWERKWHPWMSPFRMVYANALCVGCTPTECHRNGVACLQSITPERAAQEFLDLVSAPR